MGGEIIMISEKVAVAIIILAIVGFIVFIVKNWDD